MKTPSWEQYQGECEGPCQICGEAVEDCLCPECEVCGDSGDLTCVEHDSLVARGALERFGLALQRGEAGEELGEGRLQDVIQVLFEAPWPALMLQEVEELKTRGKALYEKEQTKLQREMAKRFIERWRKG